MKLLYISKGNIPSKYANTLQAMKMAEAFCDHCDKVMLVTAGPLRGGRNTASIDVHRWYGTQASFRVIRLPIFQRSLEFNTYADTRNYARAAVVYARFKSPHLVYTRSCRVARYCATAGLNTVLECHGDAQSAVATLRRAIRSKNLLGLVTVTDYLKSKYVEHGFPESNIFVWPDAVDPQRFENLPAKLRARQLLGLSIETPLVIYCGHFYQEKGVPCLIDAARTMPGVHFRLLGGWTSDIEKMRERAAGCRNIEFAGFIPNQQVPTYLAAADLLVLPNSARFEHAYATSPLKLFEYMSAKRPIVATEIPALHGYLEHNENSYIVPPDSPAALADGIRLVLEDERLARRLAESALVKVRGYTWTRRAKDILCHFGYGREIAKKLVNQTRLRKPAA